MNVNYIKLKFGGKVLISHDMLITLRQLSDKRCCDSDSIFPKPKTPSL